MLRKEQIGKKKETIQGLISIVGELVREYEKTGNKNVLTKIVKTEINELFPEAAGLQMLKWKVNEADLTEKTTRLFQKEISLADMENDLKELG
jgi:hypothetical protein